MVKHKQEAIATGNSGDRSNKAVLASQPTSSQKFQYSGKSSPCPICGRTKDEDCHWNNSVVLCHTHTEQDAGVPGYIYRGVNNIWGQYFPAVESRPKPIRAKATREFIYRDANGQPLVKVTRKDDGNGKKSISQSHWDGSRWVAGLNDVVKAKLRLYQIDHPINQAAIANHQPLLIVEGEGKVDLLLRLKIAATCSIGGAGKWKQYGHLNYLNDLAWATVVLCPDRDKPGLNHCLEVEQDFPQASWLYAYPTSAEWDNLPPKGGWDIADWVTEEKLTADQVLAAIGLKRNLAIETDSQLTKSESSDKQTINQLLLAIAEEAAYFHTPDQKVYADIDWNGIRQTLPIQRPLFKRWLQYQLFKRHQKTAGAESLTQTLGILEAKATFECEEREVHLRIAKHDGKIYLDLGTTAWDAVEISPEGWKIVTDYPVRFKRSDALLPLPMPEQGATLEILKDLLNLDEDGWILTITWLLFSLYPNYPHPILVLHGEQGTGKSVTARVLKALIDPGKAPLIPNVADLRNLAIASENRWLLAYDNLSNLNANQSDALCRISTGGGFSTRALYANDQETVFEFIRPQILTGIDSLASRGDLLERSLMVKLLTIPDDQRLTEAELETKLNQRQGKILGALLTALSQTLKTLPTVKVERLPRMADFAKFAIAAEAALNLPPGRFLEVYAGNRQEAHETALEASPVAIALQRLMEYRQSWQGTSSELLKELSALVDEKTIKSRNWAGSERSLGKALTRLTPDLRGIGIKLSRPRSNSKRLIVIEKASQQTSQTSQTSQPSNDRGFRNDISKTADVIADSGNVTGDKSNGHDNEVDPKVTPNVTAKTYVQQGFSLFCDKSDVCDNNSADCSSWVGKAVGKRHKHGWRGQIKSVDGDLATVLWTGSSTCDRVLLQELELVETVS